MSQLMSKVSPPPNHTHKPRTHPREKSENIPTIQPLPSFFPPTRNEIKTVKKVKQSYEYSQHSPPLYTHSQV